jgi:hypothetical protein
MFLKSGLCITEWRNPADCSHPSELRSPGGSPSSINSPSGPLPKSGVTLTFWDGCSNPNLAAGRHRVIETNLRFAGLPYLKRLEDFDFLLKTV